MQNISGTLNRANLPRNLVQKGDSCSDRRTTLTVNCSQNNGFGTVGWGMSTG
ncbi:hypothetical protein NG796_04410 [Laspinema sp. A4]|uniref:hypothetical protein n=1 Tax=Laspinema sp. D2d TaxID=2953686 RepID=UPI0021BAA24F|nr:hypothetical protein [Laspinema sp. D2d]MCT7982530.1 hypothetical protein [Laspinema sp. D2d]